MTHRIEIIDFIRGFSILLVILRHCAIHLPIDPSLLSLQWVKWLLCSGYYGVMMFFVVSGFLITTNCLRRWNNLQSININQFYLMRFSRIIPCLAALLVVLSILHLIGLTGFTIKNTSLQQALFSALTFQINWLEAKIGYLPANWDVLWSLSVEEVFYIFFPIVCFIFRKQRNLIWIMCIFIVLGPFARTKFTNNDMWADHSYFSCMDGIAIGCLAAIFKDKIRSIYLSRFLLFLGSVLFGFIFFYRKEVVDIGITGLGLNVTILEIGIGMIMLATLQTPIKWFKWIRWFGKNSYEIYLTHSFFTIFAANILYRSSQSTGLIVLEYLAIIICSGLLGQFIAKHYSEPCNRYIRKVKLTYKTRYSSEGL